MLLLNAANGENIEVIPESVLSQLVNDIVPSRLIIQLPMIPDMIKTALSGTIKEVTSIRTIAEAMDQSDIYKGMLTEVDKVLRLYYTFPVTSATAERSFSSLRRIKTFLRSSMTHNRLNNLFMLYVHTSKTDALDLVAIAKQFVSINVRRMNYFGKF